MYVKKLNNWVWKKTFFLREISIIENRFKGYDHKDLLIAYETLETLLLNFRIFKHFTWKENQIKIKLN